MNTTLLVVSLLLSLGAAHAAPIPELRAALRSAATRAEGPAAGAWIPARLLEAKAAEAEEAMAAGDASRARSALRSLLEVEPAEPGKGPAVEKATRDALVREALAALEGGAAPQPEASSKLAPIAASVDEIREAAASGSPEALQEQGGRLFGDAARASGAVAAVEAKGLPLAPTLSPSGREGDRSDPPPTAPPPPAPPQAPAKRPFAARHPGLLRAVAKPLFHALYDVRMRGLENVPDGPVIFVANHTNFMDPLLMALGAKRPVRAWMQRKVFEKNRFTKWLFGQAGAIPVNPEDGKDELLRAMREAQAVIKDGQSFIVFAEGDVTSNGNLLPFNRGVELLARLAGVPVVPVHVDGLWGTWDTGKEGVSAWDRLREGRRRVTVRFGAPLARTTVQSAREAVQQLGSESYAERIHDKAKTLPRAFLDSAKRHWGDLAMADSTGKELTYGKALAGSVLLAGQLKKEVEGRHVGVLLPPSVGGALANVALSELGRVPVNLNYTAGREGMGHAIQKAEIRSVVTSRAFMEALKARGLELPEADYVYLEDLAPKIPKWKKAAAYAALRVLPKKAAAALFLRRAPKSVEDTATVLFTSGSSGKPKGVELTHGNIQANVQMLGDVFPHAPHHTLLGFLPFFHSFGYTVTLWSSLLQGYTAAYHTNPLEVKAIGELAAKYHPTMLLATPTFLNHFAKRLTPEQFATLKFVIAGAEKLRKEVADSFEGKFGVRPLEGYGATELSPVASSNLPDKPRQAGNKEGSVGHPLPGTSMIVVDPETREPLPWGSEGLLLVKGPQVMKGYLKDPEKTAEALQDGWYVTGDIAVIDQDGFVTLKGRLSRFSKIAGEMVSHVAVEDALQKAAGLVDQAFVVVGVPDPDRGERLMVVYTGYEGDLADLRDKLQSAGLPNLWIPAETSFLKVEAIPVLGTGKVDLQAVKKLVEEGR